MFSQWFKVKTVIIFSCLPITLSKALACMPDFMHDELCRLSMWRPGELKVFLAGAYWLACAAPGWIAWPLVLAFSYEDMHFKSLQFTARDNLVETWFFLHTVYPWSWMLLTASGTVFSALASVWAEHTRSTKHNRVSAILVSIYQKSLNWWKYDEVLTELHRLHCVHN